MMFFKKKKEESSIPLPLGVEYSISEVERFQKDRSRAVQCKMCGKFFVLKDLDNRFDGQRELRSGIKVDDSVLFFCPNVEDVWLSSRCFTRWNLVREEQPSTDKTFQREYHIKIPLRQKRMDFLKIDSLR